MKVYLLIRRKNDEFYGGGGDIIKAFKSYEKAEEFLLNHEVTHSDYYIEEFDVEEEVE